MTLYIVHVYTSAYFWSGVNIKAYYLFYDLYFVYGFDDLEIN